MRSVFCAFACRWFDRLREWGALFTVISRKIAARPRGARCVRCARTPRTILVMVKGETANYRIRASSLGSRRSGLATERSQNERAGAV